jgi:hypothetical protein
MLLKLNNFISAFIDGLKCLFFIRLWKPFVIFALISAAAAIVVLNPFSSIWSGIIVPLGKSKLFGGGEAFVHYPGQLLVSPTVYGRINLVLSIVFDSLLSAAAFVIFAGFFVGEKIKLMTALKKALSRYHWLVIANVFVYAVLLLVTWLVPQFFEDFLRGSPRRIFLFNIVFKFFQFFVLAPFIYIMPYIILRDENFIAALWKSLRMWIKNFFTSFFLVAVPLSLTLPLALGENYVMWLSERFGPEIISLLLYLEIIVFMIASFLFTAMLTRIFTEYHE